MLTISTKSTIEGEKYWLSRNAFDKVLDKIGEVPKQEVLLQLRTIGVYDEKMERLDLEKIVRSLTDIFGPNVPQVLLEMVLLEMDIIKTTAKSG